MGVAFWLLCGGAAFAASRAIPSARPDRYGRELLVALVASLLAGLTATALDFGGWGEIDWRAGAFVICCALAGVGCARALQLLAQRVVQR
jgi:hypothetical protein